MSKQIKNAADEEKIREEKTRQKLRQDNDDNDLRFLLATDQGRRFLWKQLEACGVFKSSFTGSSETFFLEGQRNIGLKLLSDIMRVDPESYLRMIKSNKGEQ
jgi:hypothetical protein